MLLRTFVSSVTWVWFKSSRTEDWWVHVGIMVVGLWLWDYFKVMFVYESFEQIHQKLNPTLFTDGAVTNYPVYMWGDWMRSGVYVNRHFQPFNRREHKRNTWSSYSPARQLFHGRNRGIFSCLCRRLTALLLSKLSAVLLCVCGRDGT